MSKRSIARRPLAVLASLAAIVAMAACEGEPEEPRPQVVDDPHSFANPGEVRISHVHLDLDVDFDDQVLDGHAVLDFERVRSGAEELVLDTRDLDIHQVEKRDGDDWRAVDFELGESEAPHGAPLRVAVGQEAEQIRIRYTTSPDASGLQWLTPEQTAEGEHPYLYAQGQPTHARSYVPLQDSPQVRITYSAELQVPEELRALMSAENDPEAELDGVFEFEMPEPVPGYLIVLAVGDIQVQPVSELVAVYAEETYLEAAAEEFAVTQDMLEATEERYGPYRWGRYDLLVLPPSFPYGGMENPRLSFVTPTIIAGDESLISLVTHELVHSWSGNLVNNAAWRDLWLNEGFTVYLEYRIMADIYGEERHDMEAVIRHMGLLDDLEELPEERQILAVDLSDRPADDVFTSIPYAKGRLFLYELEREIGREALDDYLKDYFDHFAFQAITTEDALDYMEQHLVAEHEALSMERIEEWVYEPGLPEGHPEPQSDAFDEVDAEREDWLAGDLDTDALAERDWHALQWKYFLQTLPEELDTDRLEQLDEAFAWAGSDNYELRAAWLELGVRNEFEPALDALEDFLLEVGRMKFLRPLYSALVEIEGGQEKAEEIYAEARPRYHPLGRSAVEGVLFPDE